MRREIIDYGSVDKPRSHRMTNITFIVVCSALILYGVANLLLDDSIPPRTLTTMAMRSTEQRIRVYAAQHHRLPASLTGLPELPHKYNSLRDAWGRQLIYAPQPDGSVILSSLGKSGKPGDPNAMSEKFRLEDPATGPVSGDQKGTATAYR